MFLIFSGSDVAGNKPVQINGDLFNAKAPCGPAAAEPGPDPGACTSKRSGVPTLHRGLPVTDRGASLSLSGPTPDTFLSRADNLHVPRPLGQKRRALRFDAINLLLKQTQQRGNRNEAARRKEAAISTGVNTKPEE